MKRLDLFAGTGSITSVAKELGFDVISLDSDMPADINWYQLWYYGLGL